VVQQEIWRIKSNQELWELYKYSEIAADIKKKSLEWIGHSKYGSRKGSQENI
jgi:hypothetical protein